ncbi:hypothetical protein F4808DRAFT_83504 [Astrocystis sublimbata]|nr:hypothetical protein F4808DRAFT_83504 [Astrocystis sublimbata]
MSDAYLRTGRGGAGNFYTQKDVADAVKKDTAEDVEAQKASTSHLPLDDNSTSTTASSTTPHTTATGTYARSGRGGAGNFTSQSGLPTTSPGANTSAFPPSSTGIPKSPAPKHTGRGGAGNWSAGGESDSVRLAREEQERRRQEALESGLEQEIRLPQAPPRTYHTHAPGRGREPGRYYADRDDDDVVDM